MMLKVRYPWGITTKSVTGITLAIKRYPWQQQVLRVKYPWGLLLRAGKTGKHAGTQKRHVSGSAGGQGGRFAKKQIAKDLPGPVQNTMKAFQVMNGARSKLNKKKRQFKKAISTNDPFLRAQLPAEIKKLESSYAKAKTNFKSVQKKAKDDGYQVNALGKWSNKGVPESKKKKPTAKAKKLTATMKPKPKLAKTKDQIKKDTGAKDLELVSGKGKYKVYKDAKGNKFEISSQNVENAIVSSKIGKILDIKNTEIAKQGVDTVTKTELKQRLVFDSLVGNDIGEMKSGKAKMVTGDSVYAQNEAMGIFDKRKKGTPNSAAYKGMKYPEVVDQMRTVVKNKSVILDAVPNDKITVDGVKTTKRAVMEKRIETLEHLVDVHETFKADKWKDSYTENFSKHVMGIRNAGIVDNMPKSLDRERGDTEVYDENGKAFDNMRGKGLPKQLGDYIDSSGGNYKAVSGWMEGQAGDSWGGQPRALKQHLIEQRDVKKSEYWAGGKNGAKQMKMSLANEKREYGADVYANSMAAQHAFTYESLKKTKFEGNMSKGVQLIRTESKETLEQYGLEPGGKSKMKRGPLESASVFEAISVFGSEVTLQTVPHHRVFGSYLQGRSSDNNDGAFYDDAENEFLFMPEDIETTYCCKIESNKYDRRDYFGD